MIACCTAEAGLYRKPSEAYACAVSLLTAAYQHNFRSAEYYLSASACRFAMASSSALSLAAADARRRSSSSSTRGLYLILALPAAACTLCSERPAQHKYTLLQQNTHHFDGYCKAMASVYVMKPLVQKVTSHTLQLNNIHCHFDFRLLTCCSIRNEVRHMCKPCYSSRLLYTHVRP